MQIYIVCTELLLSACFSGVLAKKDYEPTSEDKDVLVLTESNFTQALKQHSQLLVHFCEYMCVCVCALFSSIFFFSSKAGAIVMITVVFTCGYLSNQNKVVSV